MACLSGSRNASYVDFQKKNRLNAAAGIPGWYFDSALMYLLLMNRIGLRYPLDNYQAYRSRSAPPRRLVSQSFTDHRYKVCCTVYVHCALTY